MLDFSHETRRAHVVRLFTSGAGCPDQYGGMVCGCASCLTRMLGASIVFTSLVKIHDDFVLSMRERLCQTYDYINSSFGAAPQSP